MIYRFVALCVVLLFSISPSSANDEGLYDPLPPEGSAFVRFVHAGANQVDIIPVLGKRTFADLSFQEATPYFVKEQGLANIGFDDLKIEQELISGKFYTVAFANGGVNVIEDYASENRAKALLLFYNFTSSEALTLKTDDGKVKIISAIKPGANGHRELNAVRLGTAIYSGEKQVAVQENKQTLERGGAYSIFAITNPAGKTELMFLRSRTDTTK